MKLEYNGYILEIEEIARGEDKVSYVTYCSLLPFNFPGQWNTDVSYVISRFKKAVDNHITKKVETFEYKGYLLKLGLIEDNNGQKRKGGQCEALDYKTYGNDDEANITKFKKYINWKISEEKKLKVPNSLERTEKKLDRLIELLEKKEKSRVNPFPEYSDSSFENEKLMIEFKTELDDIDSAFVSYDLHQKISLDDLDVARLSSLYSELRDLVQKMLTYMEQNQ